MGIQQRQPGTSSVLTADCKLIDCGAPLALIYLRHPLVSGVIIIHAHRNYSVLKDFSIERNDNIVSCCDHPMIGTQNYSHSTSPGTILAPLAFGVIVVHTHSNKCVLSLLI